MSNHTTHSAKASTGQGPNEKVPRAPNETARLPPPTPPPSRHRSHIPSPNSRPRSVETYRAPRTGLLFPAPAREEREPAPSVEPPWMQKLRKAEDHFREERDAAVLAELFGEDGSDVDNGAYGDVIDRRMAPPPVPLHKTRPLLDSHCREPTGDPPEGMTWPRVAGPSGLRYRDRSESGDGQARAAIGSATGWDDGVDDSDTGRGSRSESDAPSVRSSQRSLFSAASSDESSASSDGEYDGKGGRNRVRKGPKARLPKPRKRLRKTVKQLAAERGELRSGYRFFAEFGPS